MFRYKKGIKANYDKQGYVYFASRRYKELPAETRTVIRNICKTAGGEYSAALFEFVTTDITATALTMKYYISRATLYRIVRKYYEEFLKTL